MSRRIFITVLSLVLVLTAAIAVFAENSDDPLKGALDILQENTSPEVGAPDAPDSFADSTDGVQDDPPVTTNTPTTDPVTTEPPVTTAEPQTTPAPVTTEEPQTTPAPVTTEKPQTTPEPQTTEESDTTEDSDTTDAVPDTVEPDTTDDESETEKESTDTSGRVTNTHRVTESESESDTESESESEAEETTVPVEDGGKKGFSSPLEVVVFIMGVPVIISVFAVAAVIIRRIIYSDKK